MADTASVDKTLLAFLNGISKRQYFGEDDITDDFLREDILNGMAEEGIVVEGGTPLKSGHPEFRTPIISPSKTPCLCTLQPLKSGHLTDNCYM